jgi:trimethylamine--corrinoid protein Co-methyltransferase
MARYVKMPSYGGTGCNAKIPGMRSSFENGMLALGCGLFGLEINNGIGMLDCSTVLSYEQMIIDDDIVGRAIAACREVPVTKETMHLEMIKEVGILGMGAKKGSYLGERATMAEARLFYQSEIFGSEPFEQWEQKGKKDDLTVAKEKADWILKNHQPVKLDDSVAERIHQIVKEASKD